MWLAQWPLLVCGMLTSLPVSSNGLPWGVDHGPFDREHFDPALANDGKDVGMGGIDGRDVCAFAVLIASCVRDIVDDGVVFDTTGTIWYGVCGLCRSQKRPCGKTSFLRVHLSCRWRRRLGLDY